VPPVERSDDMHNLLDVIDMRIRMLAFTKADKLTDRDLHQIAHTLACALEHMKEMNEQITKPRKSARKEGTNEGQ
jgi:GTP-binding protein EngB required for normal cell division